MRGVSACAAALAAVTTLLVNPLSVSAVGLPSSMAAAGDSVTRAFDVSQGCIFHDCPQLSWATGDSQAVDSQYLRILARNPAIQGRAFNDARTGARMDDLDRQLQLAAVQQVDYAAIAMGANDVCTSSVATMTPVGTLRAQALQAIAHFTAADPHALVYLSSIPNVYNLWAVLHGNLHARWDWWLYHICQSLLNRTNSEAQRQAVLHQTEMDNQVLAQVCAQDPKCRWDDQAAFNFQFAPDDISTVDYFHPSVLGQRRIAELTWHAGYWPAS